jgi:outer membrane protein assembly factor BamB
MPFLLLFVLALTTGPASAQDWPQWRGPNRDGAIAADALPRTWPTAVARGWGGAVGGGSSSPGVANGRAFVHSRRDPEEIVTAIDLETGKVLWQQKYQAPFAKNQYATAMAKGPNSTPTVAGEALYTLGATGVLSAWRPADGTLLWRNDYSSSVDTSKLFCGTAMSPLVEQGALIVHVGSDVKGGRVLALDPASGRERWSWSGPGPGYASPIAITVGGARQVVTMTNSSIVGIDAGTGTSQWSIPFPDEWHENIITPIWTGTHLIVSGVRQGTQAFTLTRAGDKWQPAQAWRNADVTMYMSAPVIADGTIYGFSNKRKGQFVGLDAANGTVRWSTEGREGDHASVLIAPAHVVFLTNTGGLVIVKRNAATFSEERRLDIADSATYAMPAFIRGGLLVRDAQGLMRLQWAN